MLVLVLVLVWRCWLVEDEVVLVRGGEVLLKKPDPPALALAPKLSQNDLD